MQLLPVTESRAFQAFVHSFMNFKRLLILSCISSICSFFLSSDFDQKSEESHTAYLFPKTFGSWGLASPLIVVTGSAQPPLQVSGIPPPSAACSSWVRGLAMFATPRCLQRNPKTALYARTRGIGKRHSVGARRHAHSRLDTAHICKL